MHHAGYRSGDDLSAEGTEAKAVAEVTAPDPADYPMFIAEICLTTPGHRRRNSVDGGRRRIE